MILLNIFLVKLIQQVVEVGAAGWIELVSWVRSHFRPSGLVDGRACDLRNASGRVGALHIPEVMLILVELVSVSLELGTNLVRPKVRTAYEVLDPLTWLRLMSETGEREGG